MGRQECGLEAKKQLRARNLHGPPTWAVFGVATVASGAGPRAGAARARWQTQ